MLTCKEVAHLASQALDAPLTRRQRWALRLHLMYCVLCRRFVRNLHFLSQALRRARDDNFERFSAGGTLSEQARERIRRMLRDKIQS